MVIDENMNNEIKVTLVATGFEPASTERGGTLFGGVPQPILQKSVGELHEQHEATEPVGPPVGQPVAIETMRVQEPAEPFHGIEALPEEPETEREVAPVDEPIPTGFVSDRPRVRDDALISEDPLVRAEPEDERPGLTRDDELAQGSTILDDPIQPFDKPDIIEPTSESISPAQKQEPVRLEPKPIVSTLSSRFESSDEDQFDKPAYLRKGVKLSSGIIDTAEPPAKPAKKTS
jgi:hypothetical protein